MVAKIAADDPVLQHAAEQDPIAAGREGEASGNDAVRRQRHGDPEDHRRAGMAQSRRRDTRAHPRRDEEERRQGRHQGQRRAVGRRRKGDEDDQRPPLPRTGRLAEHDKMEGQHRQAGENIGEEDAGEPRQRGRNRQAGDDGNQHMGATTEADLAQQQRQDPDRGDRLQHQDRPELEPRGRSKHEPVGGRTAGHQVAFEPAGQIAACVVLEQREAVPDRRAEQDDARQ